MRSLEWQTKNAQLYFSLQKQPSLQLFVRRITPIVADFLCICKDLDVLVTLNT
jgi:hypothetical protein